MGDPRPLRHRAAEPLTSGAPVNEGVDREKSKQEYNRKPFMPLNINPSLCKYTFASMMLLPLWAHATSEEDILTMLSDEQAYHVVSEAQFEQLGWNLPDSGQTVKALADAAPGSAFDPRELESLPSERLGYRVKWHEYRYQVYGLDWDIPALHLLPNNPLPGMPTLVIVNGGASNWYEFFVDPLNRPGIGQYLAQKIPVMLVTIPGNYRHGGWTDNNYKQRVPGYVLGRDVSAPELAIRNSVYTFRVVTEGVRQLLEATTTGPLSIMGHSTGGEIQYILKDSSLEDRLGGLSIGWGTGGPAGMEVMREYRRTIKPGDYPPVAEIKARPSEDYSRGYLGPLNPFWNEDKSRLEMAQQWQELERQRKPQFKQPLQDYEHSGTDYLLDFISDQIRENLADNEFGVDAEEVIADLFSTMRLPQTGYNRMIWTTARLDTGHWNTNPQEARELLVANEFRRKNPGAPIRVLLFDLPMTHYGHIEKPRQLAGGLLVALKWMYGNR